MSVYIVARSISRPVWERLQHPLSARVLAVFERVCDLATDDGGVIALVTPQVGDGPLSIVADVDFATLKPGALARWNGERLQIGGLKVALDKAVIWEPCPDWESLRARRDVFVDRLSLLETLALRRAHEDSLLTLTSMQAGGPDVTFDTAREAVKVLRAGWEGDAAQLRAGATQLAGLGTGLTPAGDDFLTGLMLWGWLAHPDPGCLCHLLAEAAAPRTTILSAALLRAAARGECSAAWHALLAALSRGSNEEVAGAARGVLAHGATSGADALAGFLWGRLS
ncbi:MAG TPA: DUF2877 domain-containing protein [Thermoflexia bacterium]|nr:DUF2877 domain-containing protein [Thermoflexia bacterium]